jgi:hypothetical protein
MTPTEIARQAHTSIGLFRDQRDAVAEYARSLDRPHTVPLLPVQTGERYDGIAALAVSPAQLSDRLLAAIFGNGIAALVPDAHVPQSRLGRMG